MRPGIRALSGLLSRFTSLCRAIRRVIPVPLLRRYRALEPRSARRMCNEGLSDVTLRSPNCLRKARPESPSLHTIGASDEACADSQKGPDRQLARVDEERQSRGRRR